MSSQCSWPLWRASSSVLSEFSSSSSSPPYYCPPTFLISRPRQPVTSRHVTDRSTPWRGTVSGSMWAGGCSTRAVWASRCTAGSVPVWFTRFRRTWSARPRDASSTRRATTSISPTVRRSRGTAISWYSSHASGSTANGEWSRVPQLLGCWSSALQYFLCVTSRIIAKNLPAVQSPDYPWTPCDDSATSYVLPVLSMTSCFYIMKE